MKALQHLDGASETVGRIRRVLDNNLRAFVEHVPARYSAPVHMIEANGGWPGLTGAPAAAYNDGSRGWGDRLPRIQWHVMPGDHFTLLSGSFSETLAKKVVEIIQP